MQQQITVKKQLYTVWLLVLLLLTILAYANTFNASWHLDDATNIIHNPNVQVSSLAVEEWVGCMNSPFSKLENGEFKLYRPVAMLTLAMNWYLGGMDVFGYHVVNIGIHCITAVLLFYTCLNLLAAPNMNARLHGREPMVALLATAIWVLHPIQTQAVTYIVQRMASLAAMFYLLGILLYIKGRTVKSRRKQIGMFGLCLLTFLMALGSKQNAATLPVALLLIELIFYSDIKFLRQARGRWLSIATISALVGLVGIALYLWPENPMADVFAKYDLRPFTLYERVLTQFRVLMLYLYQIIYPIPQQFSIIHDVKLSTSLLNPWFTIPAIITILSLVGLSVSFMMRYRLFAFAILFYFLGHSIESTIFPLELVFEHRNYLPTLFLFLPVASGVLTLLDIYRKRNAMLFGILVASVLLLLLGLASATYTRNMDWATEKTLWQDAMQKAPSLARPCQALGMALENEGQLDQAFSLYEKALTLHDPEPKYSRFNSLGNMGNILKKKKEYDRAVDFLKAATELEKGPYANRVRFNLALCLLNSGQEKEALEQIDVLLHKEPKNDRYLNLKGFILFLQNDVQGALYFLRMAVKHNPYDMNILLNLGMVLSADGALERGAWYLKRAEERSPHNLAIHLSLLQNAIVMQDEQKSSRYLSNIGRLYSIKHIETFFSEYSRGYHYIGTTLVSVDDGIVFPYLSNYFKGQAQILERSVRGNQLSEDSRQKSDMEQSASQGNDDQ